MAEGGDTITLRVKDQGGEEMFFKVSGDTRHTTPFSLVLPFHWLG